MTTTEKDAKYKISRLPSSELRLLDQEVYGPEYQHEESKTPTKSSMDTSTFDTKLKAVESRKQDTSLEDTDEEPDADFDTRNSV